MKYFQTKTEEQVLALQHNIYEGKKINHYTGRKQNKL